ncbi:MAG: hypothetical protein Q8L35_03155 [Actinomycetota bacterium]|nr:hypothetical protein [Actinomycetota bacterium]
MKRCLIALSLIIILSATGCVQVPVSSQWDGGAKKADIYGRRTAGQDFYVSDRNLTRIDIFLYPSSTIKPKQRPEARRQAWRRLKGKYLTLSVYSLPGRERLVRYELAVNKIRTARMYILPFKPIAASKRRRFYFELKAPSLTPGSAVAVKITDHNRYKEGAAFIGGKRLAGADLGFQVYIQMTSTILVHSIASRLEADPLFMAGWGLLVLLVLTATILAWRSGRKPLGPVNPVSGYGTRIGRSDPKPRMQGRRTPR